jgi:hypothetical protein
MTADTVLFIAVGALVAVALVGIVILSVRAQQKRRAALAELAEQLGLDFEPEGGAWAAAELAGLRLFNQGHGRQTLNLMRGRINREEVAVFDYLYVTGGGKNRSTHRQTVAAFALGGRSLPRFELRPETVFDKLGAALGFQDIDFPEHPDFSARYLLRGEDEPAVRELFDGQVIEALEGVRGICVEGAGSWLVVYRAGRPLAPARIPEFLEEARSLRTAFTRRLRPRVG